MSETPTSKGMGPDEPVGSTRSGFRSRYIVILGGLAVVLVAGVILAGVIPTGDRAGSTTSDPSPSASATVEETASESASPTVSEEQSADATTDASSTDASPTPSASATVEVTTCADGGECQVGDIGPGGGTVVYASATPFTSPGSSCDPDCSYLEMAANDIQNLYCWTDYGAATTSVVTGTARAIGQGMYNTNLIANDWCSRGIATSMKNFSTTIDSVTYSDWYLPTQSELTLAKGLDNVLAADKFYWISDAYGNDPDFARCLAFSAAGVQSTGNCVRYRAQLGIPTRAF